MKDTSASLVFELLYIDLKIYIENAVFPIPFLIVTVHVLFFNLFRKEIFCI